MALFALRPLTFSKYSQNLIAVLTQHLDHWCSICRQLVSDAVAPQCQDAADGFDCPFFIAKRKDQTVCDAEICKAEKQREHARKWWNENRSKKAQGKTNTGSNTAKKGSKGNVTRKTR